MTFPRLYALALVVAGSPAAAVAAQDSLRLAALHQAAMARDPRLRQLDLHAAQTDLRLRDLAAERWPSLLAEGVAQYQSDVVTIPFRSLQHDTYDARLGVQQPILEPTIAPRRAAERAQLAESQARVHTSLYALRQEVNEAFFAAALLQDRAGALAAAITDLERRLGETATRVREGVALPGDSAAIKAALLERRQDELELHASRRAALARLAALRGRPIAEDVALVLPELGDAVTQARGRLAELRARPEYDQFARGRERLATQESVVSAAMRPRVFAFGRLGYGRPGLNLLGEEFDSYWLAGVQVQWAPWTWGRTRRERDALSVQRQILASEEAAFTDALHRGVQQDLVAMDRLDTTLVLDDEIVGLRERIEAETRLRFAEGMVTAADYVDRSTDLLQARHARAAHRVEQAHARARFLTTLGLEIP